MIRADVSSLRAEDVEKNSKLCIARDELSSYTASTVAAEAPIARPLFFLQSRPHGTCLTLPISLCSSSAMSLRVTRCRVARVPMCLHVLIATWLARLLPSIVWLLRPLYVSNTSTQSQEDHAIVDFYSHISDLKRFVY